MKYFPLCKDCLYPFIPWAGEFGLEYNRCRPCDKMHQDWFDEKVRKMAIRVKP